MDMRMVITYVVVDIFCIILAVSMSIHINRDFGNEFEVKAFRNSLASYCGFLIFGLVWILMENRYITYITAVVWMANILSLFLLLLVSYFWFMFAIARLYNRFPPKWVRIFAQIPVIVVGILCATSPFTGYAFTIDADGLYQRGPLFIFVYLPHVIYGIIIPVLAIIAATKERQSEKRRQCLLIGSFVVFPVVAGVLQMFIAEMPILAPSMVTAFFLVFTNIQSSQIYNDALTGLNNRRRAYSYLDEQLALAGENKPVTVFLMDINSFKEINDQYGHAEGDVALKTVSAALIKLCQKYHLFVARYGGDEFILVGTWRYQDRPEEIVAGLHEILADQCVSNDAPYSISLSVGYASSVEPKEGGDKLVSRADAKLYEQKNIYHKKAKVN